MIVVDANVIAYLFIQGEHTEAAESALQADPDWVAPYLWRSEFRSILAHYAGQKILSLTEAISLTQEAEALMEGGEYQVGSALVLNLATSSHCSAYDCEYVALALDLGVRLVTSDQKLLKEFPAAAISMGSFAPES